MTDTEKMARQLREDSISPTDIGEAAAERIEAKTDFDEVNAVVRDKGFDATIRLTGDGTPHGRKAVDSVAAAFYAHLDGSDGDAIDEAIDAVVRSANTTLESVERHVRAERRRKAPMAA